MSSDHRSPMLSVNAWNFWIGSRQRSSCDATIQEGWRSAASLRARVSSPTFQAAILTGDDVPFGDWRPSELRYRSRTSGWLPIAWSRPHPEHQPAGHDVQRVAAEDDDRRRIPLGDPVQREDRVDRFHDHVARAPAHSPGALGEPGDEVVAHHRGHAHQPAAGRPGGLDLVPWPAAGEREVPDQAVPVARSRPARAPGTRRAALRRRHRERPSCGHPVRTRCARRWHAPGRSRPTCSRSGPPPRRVPSWPGGVGTAVWRRQRCGLAQAAVFTCFARRCRRRRRRRMSGAVWSDARLRQHQRRRVRRRRGDAGWPDAVDGPEARRPRG